MITSRGVDTSHQSAGVYEISPRSVDMKSRSAGICSVNVPWMRHACQPSQFDANRQSWWWIGSSLRLPEFVFPRFQTQLWAHQPFHKSLVDDANTTFMGPWEAPHQPFEPTAEDAEQQISSWSWLYSFLGRHGATRPSGWVASTTIPY